MKPTERFKKRYISFLLTVGKAHPQPAVAKQIIHEHFLSVFGELGIASLAFKLIKYDEKSGKGIIRCERSRTHEAIFCMACLSFWKGEPARLEPLSTSGSVRKA